LADQGLKLSDLFALQSQKFADDVGAIVDSAGKELIIENNLKKITATWNSMSVEFIPHTDKEVQLLQIPEILTEQLEEHMVVLQGMQSSRFLAHFGQQVNELQVRTCYCGRASYSPGLNCSASGCDCNPFL